MKKFISKRAAAGIAAIVCTAVLSAGMVYADTDGTEMQVVEPSRLEIQLGSKWTGVEFQLKTDAGVYPDVIVVDDTGILSLEIGGSGNYILSCLDSSASVPAPDDTQQAPATTEPAASGSTDEESAGTNSEENVEATVAGIPVKHIVFFGAGLLLAVGCLIAMSVVKKRGRKEEYQSDDDDDDDF